MPKPMNVGHLSVLAPHRCPRPSLVVDLAEQVRHADPPVYRRASQDEFLHDHTSRTVWSSVSDYHVTLSVCISSRAAHGKSV
jgi:CRISPR/Cas system-associated endonuclease Cas1